LVLDAEITTASGKTKRAGRNSPLDSEHEPSEPVAKPGDLIFPNTIGGVEGHFLRKLQAIAGRAGIAEPELHRFRKSYADTLADEGLPVPTIMNRLGHCSLDVTLAYLRGREAEGEQEQNFVNQSALAGYA
jgi:integrase